MTGTSGAGSRISGFTLLELIAVIFIVSLIFSLALPSFRENRASDSDALKTASVLRELNDSSIARKESYHISFDLDGRLVSWLGPEGKRSMRLETLSAVELPSRGMVREGSLTVLFDTLGAPEDIAVYLNKAEGHRQKVLLQHLSGRVKIIEDKKT